MWALVGVATCRGRLLAPPVVEPQATIGYWGGQVTWGRLSWDVCVLEPPEPGAVWVPGAGLGQIIFLQAKGAPSGMAREGLVVEAGVGYRPVQIFLREGLAAIAPVVGDP